MFKLVQMSLNWSKLVQIGPKGKKEAMVLTFGLVCNIFFRNIFLKNKVYLKPDFWALEMTVGLGDWDHW